MSFIDEFFKDIDACWPLPTKGEKIHLRIIGSTALMLQTDYRRGTKDSDVLETTELTGDTKDHLLALAGSGTPLYVRHRLYIEIVQQALPFLPQIARYHSLTELNASLRHFEIEVLDIVDVVVSKLKRYNTNDVSDIEAMVDMGLVPHEQLVSRFRAAVDIYSYDARAEDLPKYVENLHRVERDSLGVSETEIELPDWC